MDFLKHALCWDEQREVFTWAGKAKYVHEAEDTLRLLGEFHGIREGAAVGVTVDTELPLDVIDREQYESAAGTLVRAALDRPDIERSVRGAMAGLTTPTRRSFGRLERIARCLMLYDPLEWEFGLQPRGTAIDAYADKDFDLIGLRNIRGSIAGLALAQAPEEVANGGFANYAPMALLDSHLIVLLVGTGLGAALWR